MKRSNVIGILAAAAVIVLSVVLISWYLTKRTPTLIQGTVECTTYKASSKVPGRIDDMKVAQGDRVEITGKSGDWYAIRFGETETGYISGQYLTFEDPATAATTAPDAPEK